jgi:colicin import membrane protein
VSPTAALLTRHAARAARAEAAAESLALQLAACRAQAAALQGERDAALAGQQALSAELTQHCATALQASLQRQVVACALSDTQVHIPVLRAALAEVTSRVQGAEAREAEARQASARDCAAAEEARRALGQAQGALGAVEAELARVRAQAAAQAAALGEGQAMAAEEVRALRARLASAELADVHELHGQLALARFDASEARLQCRTLAEEVEASAAAAAGAAAGSSWRGVATPSSKAPLGSSTTGSSAGSAAGAGPLAATTASATSSSSSSSSRASTSARIAALMASPPHKWEAPPPQAPTPCFLGRAREWGAYAEGLRREVYTDRDPRLGSSGSGSGSGSHSFAVSQGKLDPLTTLHASPNAALLAASSVRRAELALMREERAQWGRMVTAAAVAGAPARSTQGGTPTAQPREREEVKAAAAAAAALAAGLAQPAVALPSLT